MLRMRWFICPSCKHTFEELVDKDDLTATCEQCGEEASLDPNFSKQIHHDGLRYRDLSWSQWNAGE